MSPPRSPSRRGPALDASRPDRAHRQAPIAPPSDAGPVSAEQRPKRAQRQGATDERRAGRSDRALRELAKPQDGLLTLAQLGAAGLGDRAVCHRAASGRLRRVHAGVYAVGPVRSEARWRAALLATGEGTVLSHRSAAALWGLADEGAAVDVAVPTRAGRRRRGIAVHRSGTLVAADRTEHRGIRCTTVARTLLDIAAVVDRRTLERAIDRAEGGRRFDLGEVEAAMRRNPRRAGLRRLRAALARYDGPTSTRSEAEERMLALIDRAGLPRPRVNAFVALPDGGGHEIDFLWESQGLAVEVDGREFHATATAFVADRERDRRLIAAGLSVARFAAAEVARAPDRVAADLAGLLARA